MFEQFHDLHVRGNPLRLLNAWDAGSARVFEAAGAPAIGTSSAGVAYALAMPDGEALSRDQLVEAVARVVDAVSVPVTADIESGFGESPADVSETVRRIADAGAVGINIEDVVGAGDPALRGIEDQTARIAAARAGAESEGAQIFINARTDVFLKGAGPEEDRLELAISRLREFEAAGADGVFVPGTPKDAIEELVGATALPLNILLSPSVADVSELSKLGVARISVGSGPQRAAIGLTTRVAKELLDEGTITEMLDGAPNYAEANALFKR